MESTRPRHYWSLYVAAIAMYVTGVTGVIHTVRAGGGWRGIDDVAWILAGALLMLAADTRGEPSRGRLVWIWALAAGVTVTCFAGSASGF